MKLNQALACAVLTSATFTSYGAPPLREAWSDNRDFQLRIDAGRAGRAGRPCRAELFSGADGRTRRIWTHLLVNDAAPAQAYIRNDGKFVVTLDEFERGGARHALVVYGEDGELLRHFLLSDLLESQDWPHVKTVDRNIEWLPGAKCTFDDQQHQFIIQLAWGRKIQVDLRRLMVARAGRPAALPAGIPVDIAAALYGHAAPDGDVVALLEDSGNATAEPGVAEATALGPDGQPLPADADPSASSLPAGESASPVDLPAGDMQQPDATDATSDSEAASGLAEDLPVAESTTDSESYFIVPGSEIAVPRPDPAHKFDYVAWFNGLGVVDGPDAMEFYHQAIAQTKNWEGDGDLLSRAMSGDPAALANPDIQSWLAANQGALVSFRAGTQLPERGWNYKSADGSMIGVLLPELAGMRTLARASVVEARQLAAAGQPMEAAYQCLDVLAAGAHTGNGLTLIENLVGVAMQAHGQEALLDLQADPASAPQLDFVQLAAEAEIAYQPTRAPADCMQAERSMFMDAVQRLWNVNPDTGEYVFDADHFNKLMTETGGEPTPTGEPLGNLDYHDTVRQGELVYDALAEAASMPYPESRERLSTIEDMLSSSEGVNPLLKLLTPSISRAVFIRTRAETSRRATVLSTYLNAYRQQFGEYPDTLDVFADRDFVTDPFTQGRFAYRREDDGFVLYSLGKNGTDESGAHDPKGESNDMLYWPRPPK